LISGTRVRDDRPDVKSTAGSYLHSLVLTGIASGWTDVIAMVVREQTLVTESVSEIRTKLPFAVQGRPWDSSALREGGSTCNLIVLTETIEIEEDACDSGRCQLRKRVAVILGTCRPSSSPEWSCN
jgi:hypothetical protein